jgi:hypothetical protein
MELSAGKINHHFKSLSIGIGASSPEEVHHQVRLMVLAVAASDQLLKAELFVQSNSSGFFSLTSRVIR